MNPRVRRLPISPRFMLDPILRCCSIGLLRVSPIVFEYKMFDRSLAEGSLFSLGCRLHGYGASADAHFVRDRAPRFLMKC